VTTMFPKVQLADVTEEQRAALQAIHASDAEHKRIKFAALMTLIRKSRLTGTALYGGTVPAATKARRRAANKAARIARRAGR
jgi:hypothetical protein